MPCDRSASNFSTSRESSKACFSMARLAEIDEEVQEGETDAMEPGVSVTVELNYKLTYNW